jgi:hypothetical protein
MNKFDNELLETISWAEIHVEKYVVEERTRKKTLPKFWN